MCDNHLALLGAFLGPELSTGHWALGSQPKLCLQKVKPNPTKTVLINAHQNIVTLFYHPYSLPPPVLCNQHDCNQSLETVVLQYL